MGVVKRLLDDAESFAKEVTTLDEQGFISRTLAALSLADDSGPVEETKEVTTTPGAGRSQRPAPAGPASDLFVKLLPPN